MLFCFKELTTKPLPTFHWRNFVINFPKNEITEVLYEDMFQLLIFSNEIFLLQSLHVG